MEVARQGGGAAYVPFIINPSGNLILNGATNATNGNVGIGTTGPSFKLDVAGQIRSSSGGFVFPDGTVQATAASGGSSQWTGSALSTTTAAMLELAPTHQHSPVTPQDI
jgi:hypothetical protein